MSEPIRVLQVVTHMNRGGLETMLMNYYRRIDREKVQFDFLTHREGEKDYDSEIRALGGRIYHVPPVNPFGAAYNQALNAFFAAHPEYRIVHSHLDCMSAFPLRAARKHGVPVRIAHSHNTNQEHNLKYLVKLWSKGKIPAQATDLFACGEEAGAWMFPGETVHVLNNAIDAGHFAVKEDLRIKGRLALGIKNDLVLGHVGRFNAQKNHPFLIEIFSEVVKLHPDAKLLLVGDGEGRADTEKLVRQKKLDEDVLFLGVRSDIPDLLQAMDVFVFPSLYEGLPVSLVEAQAAGLPCVISDTISPQSCITDLVQQISLQTPPAQWAETVCRAAAQPRRNTQEQITAAGFDITENARWLEEFYLERYHKSDWNSPDGFYTGL